jgi:hypothetical protein
VLFNLQQMQKVDSYTLLRLYLRFSQLDTDQSGKLKIGVHVPSAEQVKKWEVGGMGGKKGRVGGMGGEKGEVGGLGRDQQVVFGVWFWCSLVHSLPPFVVSLSLCPCL